MQWYLIKGIKCCPFLYKRANKNIKSVIRNFTDVVRKQVCLFQRYVYENAYSMMPSPVKQFLGFLSIASIINKPAFQRHAKESSTDFSNDYKSWDKSINWQLWSRDMHYKLKKKSYKPHGSFCKGSSIGLSCHYWLSPAMNKYIFHPKNNLHYHENQLPSWSVICRTSEY